MTESSSCRAFRGNRSSAPATGAFYIPANRHQAHFQVRTDAEPTCCDTAPLKADRFVVFGD